MTTTTGYRFGAAHVAVETQDRDAARWLAEFVSPWFAPCPALAPTVTVLFTASRAGYEAIAHRHAVAALHPFPCFRLDREMIHLLGWSEGGTTIVADRELGAFYRLRRAGVEVIARPGMLRARIALMRVLRELLVAGAHASDRLLDVHAAACARGSGALLMVGPKEAGKTTLLAHVLRSGRASLLANDRVLVDAASAVPVAHGVPTLVALRPGTLATFADVQRPADVRPALLHSAERPGIAVTGAAAPGRDFSLSPAQLAQRCGSGTTGSAPIAAIVFPEVDPTCAGIWAEPLSAAEGAARLRAARYGAAASPRSRTIFATMMARHDAPLHVDTDVARLAAAVPLFRCRLGRDAYRDGAADLLRAVYDEPAPAEPA